ncbi:MAG TPA: tetratricopeptide repeat protein [Beijerinckiaceae bacterium]|jgi:Flp pilus assembly protein TadD
MTPRIASPRRPRRLGPFLAVGLLALSLGGCLSRSPEATGSLGAASSPDDWRRQSEVWGKRNQANPGDVNAALNYAKALRALGQTAQAVAVLQQAAIRTPNQPALLAAYGRALAEAGRLQEAAEVLGRAHSPEHPDPRILSAQGTVADQMGDHALAQKYYQSALKIAPGDPTILSNLGLSYALSKRLPEAERSLREATGKREADARVRQNLALVLGLQGKFAEAETTMRQDLSPTEVATNMSALRSMVSQPNAWSAIRRAGGEAPASPKAKADPAPGAAAASPQG